MSDAHAHAAATDAAQTKTWATTTTAEDCGLGVSEVLLQAPPTVAHARETVAFLARTTPRLGARFREDRWEVSDEPAAIAAEIVQEGPFDAATLTRGEHRVAGRPGWRVCLDRDRGALALVVHHALSDGFGAGVILAGVLQCATEGAPRTLDALAPPLSSNVAELDTGWLKEELRRHRRYADAVGTQAIVAPGESHFDDVRLSANEVATLLTAARRHAPMCSFNDVIMAHLHLALAEIDPADTLGVAMAMNMRRLLDAPTVVANLTGVGNVVSHGVDRAQRTGLYGMFASRSLDLQEHAIEAAMVEPMERQRRPLHVQALLTNIGRLDVSPQLAPNVRRIEILPVATGRFNHTTIGVVTTSGEVGIMLHTRRRAHASLLQAMVASLRG
jgi:hypothetical protein